MKKHVFIILSSIIIVLIGCKEDAPTETIDDPNKIYFEGGPNVDSKGAFYTTVEIGNQFWLKENLNVGTIIQSNSGGQLQTDNGTIEKYCYNNEADNCDIYGGLYEWNEAMQYSSTDGAQGICPSGWHIPTISEWEILVEEVGNNSNEYKAEGQGDGDGTGTNISGFSVLLAGYRDYGDGSPNYLGISTNIWSSTESGNNAYSFNLNHFNSSLFLFDDSKALGFSVRCLRD